MAIPGNSSTLQIAYWAGDPTNVPLSELNIPPYTLVLDTANPVARIKSSTTDNSTFITLGTGAGGTYNGPILSSAPTGGGLGYATGAGGAVTQATNRTTGVTLSKLAGQITTNNASLAAEAAAVFTVTNTTVAIGDVVVVAIQSGSNGGNTKVTVNTVAAGSFILQVANDNAAAGTAETGAIIINYAVIKSVVS